MSKFETRGAYCFITLTNHDQPAIVDAENEPLVKRCKSWNVILTKDGSVGAVRGRVDGEMVSLHRLIMADELEASDLDKPQVDHIDSNPLNNVKVNLQVITNSPNSRKRRVLGKTSRFPGICWHQQAEKWRARIRIDGKSKHLGLFRDELDAARAYRAAFKRVMRAISYVDYEVWAELDRPSGNTVNNYFQASYNTNNNHQH